MTLLAERDEVLGSVGPASTLRDDMVTVEFDVSDRPTRPATVPAGVVVAFVDEPAGTSEVADALGCTTQNADYRLRKLRDAGRVESKKVGRSLVWTLLGDESEA